MKPAREQLIAQLASELEPVRRPGRVAGLVLLWLGLGWASTLLSMHLSGDWRPGAVTQLHGSPRFAVETLIGLACGVALVLAGLRLGIPAPAAPLRRALPALLAVLAWVALYLAALWSEAVPPSMLGKRDLCELETLLHSLPPMLLGLLLLRRLAPLAPRSAGAVLGLAAGSLPALAMQFGCMYEPGHALTHHLAPALLTAALAALLAPWFTHHPPRNDLLRPSP
jgi:hypothetical protein